MIKKFTIAFLFLPFLVFPESVFQPTGSRSTAMGNASVTLNDLWSVNNNQAGLALLKDPCAGIYYENRFLLKELSTKAFAIAFPVKSGTFGLSASTFGYHLFSQNKYGLSYGKSLGKLFSAGVQLDYLTTQIGEEYGKKGIVTAEAGLLAMPLKNLNIGMHLFNPIRSKLADYKDERLPTIIKLGLSYGFSEKVIVAIEAEKNTNANMQFKAGVEYKPVKTFYLRAGINTYPSLSSFGFGFEIKQFSLDLASSFHPLLGISTHAGFTYTLNK